MVEERLIEVTLLSASNLKDVNYLSKMETYAVLKFAPYVDYTTHVDHNNGQNPSWKEKLGFMIPEGVLRRGDGHLKVEIFTLSTLGPKFVCEASIPLIDIALLPRLNEPFVKKYPLKTNSGEYHGDLTISFSVKDKVLLKSSDQEPSFPIVTGFGTNRPTYDSTSKPTYPSSPTPSQPYLTSPQLAPPHGRPIMVQSPMPSSQLAHPNAYGSQPTPPPTHGKPYEYSKPLSQVTTTLPTRPPPSAPQYLAYPPQTPNVGASQGLINVPITRTEESVYGYGSTAPFHSGNGLFGGPVGKMLLADRRPYGGAY